MAAFPFAMRGLLLVLVLIPACCGQNHQATEEKQLVKGNKLYVEKPADGTIRTLKRKDDVIDCVDIYKQPSMSHPTFENHTIQMRPTSYPIGLNQTGNTSALASQVWPMNEACPDGTVPIRRKLKDESVSIDLQRHLQRRTNRSNGGGQGSLYAKLAKHDDAQQIDGVSSRINVWNPWAEDNDYTVAQMSLNFLRGETFLETAEVGWMVNPKRYKDGYVRLYILYTNNGYQSVCYDLECPGFVMVDKSITPGVKLFPVSLFGRTQFIIDVGIFLDRVTKNLWLRFGDKLMGYWLPTMFPNLSKGSNFATWGGEVFESPASSHPTRTQMGSGRKPEEGYKKACFINYILYRNADGNDVEPDPNSVSYLNTNFRCYDISSVKHDRRLGNSIIFFGGSGRSSTCT